MDSHYPICEVPASRGRVSCSFMISLTFTFMLCRHGTLFLKKQEINNNHKWFKKFTAFILGLLHNHGKEMKHAIPIMAVIQRVEMNPPMHICLCLWRSLTSFTLFMKSSIPPSIRLTFSKSYCSWVVIDFIIFVDLSLFFKKVSSNKLFSGAVYLLAVNVQVMIYFSRSCRAIIYGKM